MCVVCGCSETGPAGVTNETSPAGQTGKTDLHFGAGAARVSVPGLSQARTVKLEADILGENNRIARRNRHHFQAHGVTALNLVSGPGSGKTTLLCATIEALKQRAPALPVAVIEGDQQTSLDADRIRTTGCRRSRSTPARAATSTRRWSPRPSRIFTTLRTTMPTTPPRAGACCSSKTSATSSAPRCGTWARTRRSPSCRSPRARTSL